MDISLEVSAPVLDESAGTGSGWLAARGAPVGGGLRRSGTIGAVFDSPNFAEVSAARLTESAWQRLRAEAAVLEYSWAESYRQLVEAAWAEPVLRALYPFTSHWGLRFSTATGPLMVAVGPVLSANGDGEFGVGTGILATSNLGRFATAGEAVAWAVRELPPGVGPVRLGGPVRPGGEW
ncbi:DUF6193 family natural product biosynthesis protein [Kitasatospora sp. NPDC059673]|uniref:DUF6193 family natural product biosynthesis protein n=1 Tax=Kitasatospora sp. NPDC059673 TaxID=3346901 RepID=UPI0036B3C628